MFVGVAGVDGGPFPVAPPPPPPPLALLPLLAEPLVGWPGLGLAIVVVIILFGMLAQVVRLLGMLLPMLQAMLLLLFVTPRLFAILPCIVVPAAFNCCDIFRMPIKTHALCPLTGSRVARSDRGGAQQ